MAGTIADLTSKSTQSSPDCFIRVLQFRRRDTREFSNRRPVTKVNKGPEGIRHLGNPKFTTSPNNIRSIDIASDIIQCTVTKSKSEVSGGFSITLSPADLNYHHLLHPGDHIFIWMRRRRILPMKKNNDNIWNNNEDSGLKLWGVITSVRRKFITASDGKKMLVYVVNGKDFGYFFESDVYYNKTLADIISRDLALFQTTQLGISQVKFFSPNQLVTTFMKAYIGRTHLSKEISGGIGGTGRPVSENSILYLPPGVGRIFDDRSVKQFKDILHIHASIEKYKGDSVEPNSPGKNMEGVKFFHVDIGTKYKLWSIMKAYSNPTVNEMFVDLKLTNIRNKGKRQLQPTFVLRQIPFTTAKAGKLFDEKKIPNTKYIEIPRIKIPEKFILSENIGRGDHERFNLIELFGTYPGLEPIIGTEMQIAKGNYAIDIGSIQRHGMRALIPTTDYHFPDSTKDGVVTDKEQYYSLVPKWINLLSDWWLGAHTLENGSFTFVGIEEPISIGDNIELIRKNGVNELYHIEGYTHNYVQQPGGVKNFRTEVKVSRGQRVDEFPVYASGQINEEDILDIGLTGTEPELTTRHASSASGNEDPGVDPKQLPRTRKKEDKTR